MLWRTPLQVSWRRFATAMVHGTTSAAILLAAVRNGCRLRGQRHVAAAQRPCVDAGETPMFEDPERYVEADTVARAFASLNPRWQQTLWLTEVEQRSPAEVATRMDLAPNATAALTLRAREAFATAYLAEHVSGSPDEVCERYGRRLAAYVRDQLTDLQRDEIERHLVECQRCQLAVNELSDVNSSLRKLLPPVAPGTHRTMDRRHHARHDVEPVQLRTAAQGCDRASRRDPAARPYQRTRSWRRAGRPGRQGGGRRTQRAGTRVRASRGHAPAALLPELSTGRASAGTTTTTIAPAEESQLDDVDDGRKSSDRADGRTCRSRLVRMWWCRPVVDDVVVPAIEDVVVPVVDDVVDAGGR